MSDEAMDLPIGGDFSGLETAFAAVVAAVDRLGDRIVASLERSNVATDRAAAGVGRLNSAHAAAAGAVNASASANRSFTQRLGSLISTAGHYGEAVTNIAHGIKTLNTAWAASRNFIGQAREAYANLRTTITGLRSAITSISQNGLVATMKQWLASSKATQHALEETERPVARISKMKAFALMAAGAVAAAGAIGGTALALRGLRSAFGLVQSVASRIWGAIGAGARGAAAAVRGAFGAVRGAMSSVGSGISALMTPFTSLAGVLGMGGVLYLAVSQFKAAWQDAADFEQMQTRIEQFTGSAQKAAADLARLDVLSAKTPFELPDLTKAQSMLMGAGITGDIPALVKSLGELAQNGEQLTDFADALGKGFAKGRFQTEQMNKFLERGVNLRPELEAVIGVSGKALDKAIETGLAFDQVKAAIERMSAPGGQFFGMLERQSKTAAGVVSNLADNWGRVRRAFMQPLQDALKPILVGATDALGNFIDTARNAGKEVGDFILRTYALIQSGHTSDLLRTGLNYAVQSAMDLLMRGFTAAVTFLGHALPPVFEAAFAKLSDPVFWKGINSILQGVGETLAAEIKGAFPMADEDEVSALHASGAINRRIGAELVGAAGSVDFGGVITKALMDAGHEADLAWSFQSEGKGLKDARSAFQQLMESVNQSVQRMRDSVEMPPPPKLTPAGALMNPGGGEDSKSVMIQTAMARIGGGGFGLLVSGPMVREQQRGNQLLRTISGTLKGVEANTKKMKGSYA